MSTIQGWVDVPANKPPLAASRGTRGQSLAEFALLLPLLLTMLMIVIEGGLMLRSYNSLVSSAWVGARFGLDGATDADIVSMIRDGSHGLNMSAGTTDIYIVRGGTNASGAVVTWTVTHGFGTGSPTPQVRLADIQTGLISGMHAATYSNVTFILVEVDYRYRSDVGSWILPVAVPMNSYSILQKL